MGGRGSTSSAVDTYGRKSGVRLNPKQFKEALSTHADNILRDISPELPKQFIIRKSFSANGFATVEIDTSSATVSETYKVRLSEISKAVNAELMDLRKQRHTARTWSEYDEVRAKAKIYTSIDKSLKRLLKK